MRLKVLSLSGQKSRKWGILGYMAHPPKSLQPILWSAEVSRLDLEKDKGYIIPQVFIYGTMDELKWLFQTYGRETLTRHFLDHPAKLYSKKVFHFVKNNLLHVANKYLDEEDYVTSISGPLRQRAANRV